MNISVSREAAHAASAPIRAPSKPEAIHAAALQILICLDGGRRVDSIVLRAAMEHAFGGSDADGAWDWKSAYEACEAATVLFLRKLAPALRASSVPLRATGDSHKDRGVASHPHPSLRREPGLATVLDADSIGPRCLRRRRAYVG